MPWSPEGQISVNNNSMDLLGAGGVFTGAFEFVLGFSILMINISSNVNSATNGLEIQWSSDGFNVLHVDAITTFASNEQPFLVSILAPWFRVKYTNGATPQATFRLLCAFQKFGSVQNNLPLGHTTLTSNQWGLVTRAVHALDDGSGTYVNLKVGQQLAAASQPVVLASDQVIPVTLGLSFSPKSASININSSGNNTIVAAVASKRIKVFAYAVQSIPTGQDVKFRNDTASDLTGPFALNTREGVALSVAPPAFLFGTSAGNALVLNLSAAKQVVGFVSYWDTDAT